MVWRSGVDDLLCIVAYSIIIIIIMMIMTGGLDNVFALFALGLFFAVGSVLEVEMARTRRATPAALRNFFDMWRDDGE
jgi:Mg2+/citrate symporter